MRLLRRLGSPLRDVDSLLAHLDRLGYEVVEVADLTAGRAVVEFAGRVSGVVLLDSYREYLLESTSVRVRAGGERTTRVEDSLLRAPRGSVFSRRDLVTGPYSTAREYRRLAELRAWLALPVRARYLEAAAGPGETYVERAALRGWNPTSPREVAAATSLLEDLVAGVPVEWARRRAASAEGRP